MMSFSSEEGDGGYPEMLGIRGLSFLGSLKAALAYQWYQWYVKVLR